jgi:hypothetical protein
VTSRRVPGHDALAIGVRAGGTGWEKGKTDGFGSSFRNSLCAAMAVEARCGIAGIGRIDLNGRVPKQVGKLLGTGQRKRICLPWPGPQCFIGLSIPDSRGGAFVRTLFAHATAIFPVRRSCKSAAKWATLREPPEPTTRRGRPSSGRMRGSSSVRSSCRAQSKVAGILSSSLRYGLPNYSPSKITH